MQIGPRIRFDKHTLGNLLKNFAPIAGAAAGGVPGFLLAGGMSAGGDLARGKNVSVGNAITNAGLAYGGGKAMDGLRSAFTPSSGMQYGAGDVAKGAALTAKDAVVSGAKNLGTQAVKNPLVVGQIAGGVLDARAQGAQTDLARQQFDFQKQQHDEQEERRRRLQELLAPLLQGYQPQGGLR